MGWINTLLLKFGLRRVGIGISVPPPTLTKLGDFLFGEPMPKDPIKERVGLLKDLCNEAMNRWPPKKEWRDGDFVIVETYCNISVQHVCKGFEYTDFNGLLANQIVQKMKTDANWAPVEPIQAQILANEGRLVIAGLMNKEGSGHVAVVWPTEDKMPTSKKWDGAKVPWVANVGKENGIMGANWAFDYKPGYWAFVEDA